MIHKRSILLFIFLLSIFFYSSCKQKNSPQPAYLEINLNISFNSSFISAANQPLEIFQVIEKAALDDNIRGIIFNVGSFPGSVDYLWELRSALEKFKLSGKKVIAFFSYADINTYLLASAADKIIMDPLGTLSLTGYAMGRGYVKNMLEKLGIGVRELRYFEYKSAGEMYTRDSFSQADRKQYSDYLDDIFSLTKETLKNARNWTEDDFEEIINRDFLYTAGSAVMRNLIDYTGRADAVLEAVNELEDEEINNFYIYGNTDSSITGSSRIYSVLNTRRISGGTIAVVYAEGQTDMEMGMACSKLSRIIRSVADNRRVSAIVLRINSPGGSAEAADYIDEAVRYAKQFKPVVVSMGNVAASGGYWAAMSADHIVSNPYTITGSIGVIGNWLYDNGFSAKLGFNTDIIKRGDHSDLNIGFIVPYRDLTETEEERYKQMILDMYNIFIEKAAAGRGMEISQIEKAAQGRIFSGIRALEEGLVDSVGGLFDAIRVARNLAGIDDDKKVNFKKYPEPTFMEQFIQRFSSLSVDMFIPDADVRYRLINNGQVMPILPLEF